MNKTTVNIYRGTHGMGVVIAISFNKDRVILDFGAPFTPLSQVYDGEVRARQANRVKDALLLERIPQVPGVFSRKDLQDLPLQSYEDSAVNSAVFISHLHLDHMSEADKVDSHIPVYIHQEGIRLQNALNTVEEKKPRREFTPFSYHQTVTVGQIKVTPYYSDHPCPGSSGFLVETPDSTVYYSGDIRFHGVNSEKAWKELDKVSQHRTDLLIVDATTTSPAEFTGELISEQDIYDDIFSSLKDFTGLGIVNMYNRDVAMMRQIVNLADKLGRTAVFEPSFAFILQSLYGIKVPVWWLDNQHIPEFREEMKETWEMVPVEQIRKHPERYLLQNSYANILSLSDLDKLPGKYFHLFGEPLVKGAKEYQIMGNVVAKLGWQFRSYTNLYSFSHTYPEHLRKFIEKINAESVIAVHSSKPENLDPVSSTQFFPEEGREYLLENGQLKSL